MKKLLVKIKVIDIPYSAAVEAIAPIEAIEAQPEKWVKGDLEVFEQPMIEIALGEFQIDESFTHHPAIEAVLGVEGVEAIPEILEVSHDEIISQTQGNDEELAEWLAGDSFKYPEGYWVEYIDLEQDFGYLLAKCHSQRLAEYPSLGDQMDASFKARQGDDSQQLAIDTLIQAVKAKYPKPQVV
jgi:hypothetical protein